MSQEVELKEREPLQNEGGKAQVIKMNDAQNGGAGSPTRAAPQVAFAGMTKEELMQFANDPFWVRLRWFLFILFWLIWFGMIAGAVLVIITAPKCPEKREVSVLEEKAIAYVPANTFKDRSGKGDLLSALTGRLDSLKQGGMDGVWLERLDDVTDPMDIDNVKPEVLNFLEEAHKRGEHVLLEINPNHTPKTHPWFKKSASKDPKYKDYYIWRPTANNWLTSESGTGTTAWEKDPQRGEYYYASEALGYPDLNMRNADVRSDVSNVLRFWLDKHVAGFVMSGVRYLFEDPTFRNAPESKNATLRALGGYASLDFDGVSRDHPENRALVAEWKTLVDEHSPDGAKQFMIVKSAGALPGNATAGQPAHGVVAEEFGSLEAPVSGFAISHAVDSVLGSGGAGSSGAPFALWPVAFQRRPMDAFKDKNLATAMVAIAALLPGAPVYMIDVDAAEPNAEVEKLMALRSEAGFKFGNFKKLFASVDTYAFSRIFGKHGYVVVGYFGLDTSRNVDVIRYDGSIPEKGVVTHRTVAGGDENTMPGKEIPMSSITVAKDEVVVVAFEPLVKE